MNKKLLYTLLVIFMCNILLFGCDGNDSDSSSDTTHSNNNSGPKRDSTPVVLIPESSGTVVYENDIAAIDASNSSSGYAQINYKGSNPKVRLRFACPDGVTYTYAITNTGGYETFPFTSGNGTYNISVLENLDGDEYVISLTQDIDVTLSDEFLPFLYPNQYVNFTVDSAAISKAQELVADSHSELDTVALIYNYVIDNIEYDDDKATNVTFGYSPDVDETLSTKKGICFDYASLMTAMLRSQRIPTKLEVGYAGEVYHAWISTYITDVGWVDDIIEFDGHSWSLMDPTFASNSDNSSLKKFIGNGSNYVLKYTY
ncbi:MAG: transglutaminase domain-containing protein [Suipraeoptans sp.]